MEIPITQWKEEEASVAKDDVLNGLAYDSVSDIQQMIHHCLRKIEDLEARVAELEK